MGIDAFKVFCIEVKAKVPTGISLKKRQVFIPRRYVEVDMLIFKIIRLFVYILNHSCPFHMRSTYQTMQLSEA